MQLEPDLSTTGRQPSRGYRRSSPRPPRFTLDRVIRFLLGASLVAIVAWLIWNFASLIFYLMLGLVVAYLLRPVVDRFQGIGLGRIPAIMATFVLVIVVISILLTFLVPFVGRQVGELSEQISLKSTVQITGLAPSTARGNVLLESGDIILSVDGQVVREFDQVQALVREKAPGDSVLLAIQDTEGRTRDVQITFGVQLEEPTETPADLLPEEGQPLYGLGLRARTVMLSDVIASIENQLRKVVPLEEGVILDAVTGVFETLFQADQITEIMGAVVAFFTDIFYALLVVPFVAFFVLKDGGQIRQSLLRLVPNRYFELTIAMYEKVETNIGRYFKALFLQSLSIATVATVGLTVVGLNSALAVGLFAGLANTIPYFGPLMGLLAGALVGIAQTGDFSLLLGVLIAMGLTQIADNVLFQPLIFSRAAQAHPLVILFVVLIGAQLGGIIGMLIAIPFTTIVRVMVQQILWSLRNYRILQPT
ncbi:MAG: AI-2E family transporter [Bacteroidetes bacterium]|nr:AI-2E family transporter [Bacteroidota bacterium]